MLNGSISDFISSLILLGLIGGVPLYAWWKKVDVFPVFVQGAKEGFETAVGILPYLVGFMVAIGMFRASSALALFEHWLAPMTNALGISSDIIPLALIRPFSGGAATGMLADIAQAHGGDAYSTTVAAILMGSTETTFYVLMVYFGAVGIKKTRHAAAAGLTADFAGVVLAILVGWVFFR